MLSVLIPCYNYPCFRLVETLHRQCSALGINFEILVSEDGGNSYIKENAKIDALTQCTYIVNTLNVGRAGNLNRLLNRSAFQSKLILDCDVMPQADSFIKNYTDIMKLDKPLVCFGGIAYAKNNHPDNLRYNYGVNREAKSAQERFKTPYKSLLTSNVLIMRCHLHFDENITTYGYEDLVFAENLKAHSISVFHSDNPVLHLNL